MGQLAWKWAQNFLFAVIDISSKVLWIVRYAKIHGACHQRFYWGGGQEGSTSRESRSMDYIIIFSPN
jgi:hypothetical protein